MNEPKYKFSRRSLERLQTCDERLIKLMQAALDDERCPCDFTVLEGRRAYEQQVENVRRGVSKTMKSRHLEDPSRAVDVAPYPVDWQDIYRFQALAKHIKAIARELEIDVTWGGDWRSIVDMPHWQVD